jgi:hypothetical protein
MCHTKIRELFWLWKLGYRAEFVCHGGILSFEIFAIKSIGHARIFFCLIPNIKDVSDDNLVNNHLGNNAHYRRSRIYYDGVHIIAATRPAKLKPLFAIDNVLNMLGVN